MVDVKHIVKILNYSLFPLQILISSLKCILIIIVNYYEFLKLYISLVKKNYIFLLYIKFKGVQFSIIGYMQVLIFASFIARPCTCCTWNALFNKILADSKNKINNDAKIWIYPFEKKKLMLLITNQNTSNTSFFIKNMI
jgi:hypothetical protein